MSSRPLHPASMHTDCRHRGALGASYALVMLLAAGCSQSAGAPGDSRYCAGGGEGGLSERQVQIAWVKVVNPQPRVSLPSASADAFVLAGQIGQIARALKTRYPNLQQMFLSSRIYAGYANTDLNPEPYAFESGFSVKWAIESQIDQMAGGSDVGRTGDLRHDAGVAPWVGWGPYLWADGTTPRPDGLTWEQSDFMYDGTHPAAPARRKVGTMLLTFFTTSPVTSCWFLAGRSCYSSTTSLGALTIPP